MSGPTEPRRGPAEEEEKRFRISLAQSATAASVSSGDARRVAREGRGREGLGLLPALAGVALLVGHDGGRGGRAEEALERRGLWNGAFFFTVEKKALPFREVSRGATSSFSLLSLSPLRSSLSFLTWNHSVSTCSFDMTFSIDAKSVATTMSFIP